jgi:hypothetical protein
MNELYFPLKRHNVTKGAIKGKISTTKKNQISNTQIYTSRIAE